MKTIKFLTMILLTTLSLVSQAENRPTMTQSQLTSLQSAPLTPKFTLLDVRSAEEYQAGHIKGAVNIAHSELTDKLNMLPQNKDEIVVVYCRSGRRAGIAEQILRDNGYTKVRHLDGDMKGWQDNKLPVSTK